MSRTRTPSGISPIERKASLALAGIFSLRLLGLFMILPVFALHAGEYTHDTALLTGLAIGIYGLTQALFQIPFGMLSDRIGRKVVITVGLLLFAAGSVMCAMAHNVYFVVAGRAMQGLGAIGSAVMALAADLTREENRTKAMGVIGASIGLAFAAALVLGPALTRITGLAGVFWITAVLALVAIVVLHVYVPQPVTTRFHRDTQPVPGQLARVLGDGQLLRLDAGIMILHMVMTATFVAVPLVLHRDAGLQAGHQWLVYLVVMALSVVLMVPAIIYADRRNRLKQVFMAGLCLLAAAQVGLYFTHASLFLLSALLAVYFTGFNILEASLPSLVTRVAPPEMKGTALGAYSTSQYLGAFIGGVAGGWLFGHEGPHTVFAFCAALVGVWLLVAAGMRNPRALSSRLLRVGVVDSGEAGRLSEKLAAVPGVVEAVVIAEDGVAYLKVDRKTLDDEALAALVPAPA